MAQEYITLSEDALSRLCSLIKAGGGGVGIIDDKNVATNSVYSSAKITELFNNIKTTGGTGGKGISSIELESSSLGGEAGQAGAIDTYKINYSDNTSSTFKVYNGQDGTKGTRILSVRTNPSTGSGTLPDGTDYFYKIRLTSVQSQANVTDVYVEDLLLNKAILYQVVGVDEEYVYMDNITSIKGDSPTIGEDGNWYIGGTDTGVSAGGSGSSGTIKVKTGKFDTDPRGYIIQNNFLGLSTAKHLTKFGDILYCFDDFYLAKITNPLEEDTSMLQISGYDPLVSWGGMQNIMGFKYFFVQEKTDKSQKYYYVIADSSRGGGVLELFMYQTPNEFFEDYLTCQKNNTTLFLQSMAIEPYLNALQTTTGLYLFKNNGDNIQIITNNPTITGTHEDLTIFREVNPGGNRLNHLNYEFWSKDKYIFIKNLQDNIIEIWDTETNIIHAPSERDIMTGDLYPLEFSYIDYFPAAKAFIAYQEFNEAIYYCETNGLTGPTDWIATGNNIEFFYNSSTLAYYKTTENYLYVPTYNSPAVIYNKNFEKVGAAGDNIYLNFVMELDKGVLFSNLQSDIRQVPFETEEITIEQAINRLV